jgi:hypothetical protein
MHSALNQSHEAADLTLHIPERGEGSVPSLAGSSIRYSSSSGLRFALFAARSMDGDNAMRARMIVVVKKETHKTHDAMELCS